jgi:hypothetical protein
VNVDELHRPGESGDPVGDPQLKVRGALRLFRYDDRVVWAALRLRSLPVMAEPGRLFRGASGVPGGPRRLLLRGPGV